MDASDILDTYGWQYYIEKLSDKRDIDMSRVARVTAENKTNYTLITNTGERTGVLRGKTHMSMEASKVPKVGDWVICSEEEEGSLLAIESVLPRFSTLSRHSVGDSDKEQVMVSNVDQVFIVQGLDDNFNINRLERYLVMVENSGAKPIIILNKTDLTHDIESYRQQVCAIAPEVPIVTLSALSGDSFSRLRDYIEPFSTSVFIGSSGVGKSTILNDLLGGSVQDTQGLRGDDQGRHTTTRRELFVLPNKAILIDTPGMREVSVKGLEKVDDTFADIEELTSECKYTKCDHEQTEGCALLDAVDAGDIEQKRVDNYLKLERELDFEESKGDRKRHIARAARIKNTKKGYKKILRDKYKGRGYV